MMNYNTGTLGLPIVLLASLWGAVNTTLTFFKIINERRDQVFGLIDSCGNCPELTLGPLPIYFTNVVPLTLGVCLFLVLICYVITSIPRYMNVDDEDDIKRMMFACKAIASLPAFGLVAFILGGAFDAIMIYLTY
jgi:hypothetical protein